jgi:hypothetical protein
MSDNEQQPRHGHSALIPGVIVAGIGVLLLLNNLNIVYVHDWWKFWPLILIAIGAARLIDSPHPREKTGGAIMVIVGGIFLSTNLGVFSWSIWAWWPLLLIGVGLMMLFNRGSGRLAIGLKIPGEYMPKADGIAIFGGFKRRVVSDDYRGANYVAIFGGGEIDLRRVQIRGESALVDITAIFGGFEIRVPQNWIVVNEMVGIFGGTGDETRQPSPNDPDVKRLIVRGAAIFGGVGIKN